MSLTRRVAHNTIVQVIGKILGTVLAFVTAALMLRYLGRGGFGGYTTIMTFLALFSTLADLGLYLIVTREISKGEVDEEAVVNNAFTIKLLAGLVIVILVPLIGFFFPYTREIKLGIVTGVGAYLFILLDQVLIAAFQKYYEMWKVALAEVISRAIWLGGVVLVAVLKKDLVFMMAMASLANFVNFTVLYLFLRKHLHLKLAFNFVLWKRLMKMALPLALSVVFTLVYFRAGVFILSIFKSAEAVGIYGAAYKVMENLITFAAIFAGVLLPAMSEYAFSKPNKFALVYQKGMDVVAIFIIPLIVGTLFLAEPVMVLFGGQEFEISSNVLKVLMFSVGAIYFSTLVGNAVVAVNQQKKMLWIYLSCAILSVVFNLLLIPYLSYYGTALTSVMTEMIVLVTTIVVVWRTTKVRPALMTGVKSLAAAGVMALFLYFFREWNFMLQLVAAIAIYFSTLYLERGFSLKIVREIISFRNE